MNAHLEIEPEPTLDIEPEPEPAAAQTAPAPAAPLALVEVLPADFPLPILTRFVPDARLKVTLSDAVLGALAVPVTGADGLVAADQALATVRASVKAIEAHFEEPTRIANDLHKHLTRTRGEWTAAGVDAVTVVGRRIASEKARLDGIAREERRKAQEQADADARAARAAEAKAAQAQGAPAAVVQQMQQQAAVATAAPVPVVSAAPVLASTTVTKTWKARVKGTPADAEPRPQMADLTAPQQSQVRELMAAVIAGTLPLTLFEINWSVLNDRAKGEKGTLALPGIEAYEETGTRAKPGRRF